MAQTNNTISKIQRTDDDRQIVYGMVYAPMDLDTWGEAMTAEDIETMAHRFMALKLNQTIDEMHNEDTHDDVYPIESFIARKGDADYPEGSWVLGVKVDNDEVWKDIKDGALNGFSFQAMVKKVAAVVEIEYDPEVIGRTEESNDHYHLFFAQLNEDGIVVSGRTSTEAGHSHAIKRGTATEESDGHKHRYFI